MPHFSEYREGKKIMQKKMSESKPHAKFHELEKLVKRNRSFRRFNEHMKISRSVLLKLVNLARLSASSGNCQPLKYFVSCTAKRNALVFPCLAWAGYLKDWSGPAAGERPSAYIVILGDPRISKNFGCDHGIAAQSIMLGSSSMGLGGCMIGSIDRDRLRKALKIAPHFEILLVLALGRPREIVRLEKVMDGDIKYWRDKAGIHHVPKRVLRDIIIP